MNRDFGLEAAPPVSDLEDHKPNTREERCTELGAAIMQLMPAIIEGQNAGGNLSSGLGPLSRIRAVADQGADGIDDPAFLAWLDAAPSNIAAIESAIVAGDANAAFEAFRDQRSGLHLLAGGCAGCPGW